MEEIKTPELNPGTNYYALIVVLAVMVLCMAAIGYAFINM
jgi:hypothetical protein